MPAHRPREEPDEPEEWEDDWGECPPPDGAEEWAGAEGADIALWLSAPR
jgi:hypothetical protein